MNLRVAFCSTCGAPARPGTRFCTSCGMQLTAAVGQPAPTGIPEPGTTRGGLVFAVAAGAACTGALVVASSLVSWLGDSLGVTGGSVAAILGTVLVAMSGTLACVAVVVAARRARGGALGFAAAASGLVAAGVLLAWGIAGRFAPAWVTSTRLSNGLGALVVLTSLVLTLTSRHVHARHRLQCALTASAAVAVYVAATPLIATVDLAHLPRHWTPAHLLGVAFDTLVVVASVALVIVVADPPVAAAEVALRPRKRPLAEAAMSLCALVLVVLATWGTLVFHGDASPAEFASTQGTATTAGTFDDRLGGFVDITTGFHRRLSYELQHTGDGPCADDSTSECTVVVELRALLAECEKAWPPNLAPEIDASIAGVIDVLRAELSEFESMAGRRPGTDQSRLLVDLDTRFRAAMSGLGETVSGTGRTSTCAHEALSSDLAGPLGGEIVPDGGAGRSRCGSGWAIVVVERPAPCPSACEVRAVARMVEGKWEPVTELPGTTCEAQLAGEGAPDFVRAELPRCADVTQAGSEGDYQVTERPDRSLELSFASDVLFDFGSADLTATARQTLDKIVQRLASASGTIQVEGHTDSISSAEYNQQLSERRATAVRDYLSGAGVTVPMDAVGFGLERPVAPNTNPDGSDNPDGRARNRRVTITYKPT